MRIIRPGRLLLPAVLALLSCTDPSEPRTPTSITIVSGNDQSGSLSSALPNPIVVEVRDTDGRPIRGATVTWTVVAGGGSVSAATSTTDGAGRTQMQWVLGPDVGPNRLNASVSGVAPAVLTALGGLDQVVELQSAVTVGGVAAPQGISRYYRIRVPDGSVRLTVTLTGGTGDVDLFVRRDEIPTTSQSDCESTSPVSTETCIVNSPAPGDWFILLDAYTAYSGVALRASLLQGGGLTVNVGGVPAGAAASVSITGAGYFIRDLTGTQTLNLTPGTYTVSAQNVLHNGTVYVATPSVQQVAVTSGASISAAVAYAPSATFNLDITGAYITQGVQRTNGSVPLVAGRDGVLRVFARASAVNTATPDVRVRIYQNGTLADTRSISAPAASVPAASDEAVLTSTWNVLLPGSLIQPGMSLLVDVDPANGFAEAVESDNSFPASGTPLPLDVRAATLLQARLVPVRQSANDSIGDVTADNAATYTTLAQALYPLPGIDVDVRAPYTFTGQLPSQYDSTWTRLLSEINALRAAEAPTRYYYGVIKPAYTSGGTGLGYIGLAAAIGVDWSNLRAETVAHEWGHNFGRLHVGCGNPAGPDPDYPYTDRPGAIGFHGYDLRTNTIRSRETHHDLMSYCNPTWASDYTYEAVLAFRAGQQGAGATQPALLVWGRISPDGVQLEPAFEVVTTPVLPAKPGRYRVTGTDAAGATVFDISFEGHEIDHMPGERHFAFAVPLRSMRGTPSELRLTGGRADAVRRATLPGIAAGPADDVRAERADAGNIRVQWNATRNPVVIVRDVHTGAILSFARGGDARVATNAAEVEVNMSDGVRSAARRIVVRR